MLYHVSLIQKNLVNSLFLHSAIYGVDVAGIFDTKGFCIALLDIRLLLEHIYCRKLGQGQGQIKDILSFNYVASNKYETKLTGG